MTMEYGPAPEDPREALAWLDVYNRRPFDWRKTGDGRTGLARRYRPRRQSSARCAARVASSVSPCPRTLPLRASATGAETFALARSARNAGQRQAHSREP